MEIKYFQHKILQELRDILNTWSFIFLRALLFAACEQLRRAKQSETL